MTIIFTEQIQEALPLRIRKQVSLKVGDRLDVSVMEGVITMKPVPPAPAMDEEYTPVERRTIDAQLAAAEGGSFHGPFGSADEMIAHMKNGLMQPGAKQSKRSR